MAKGAADRPGAESIAAVVDTVASFLAVFDFAQLSGPDAQELATLLARLERLAATGKALAARRASDCSQWVRSGARSPAEWLAAVSGTPVGAAQSALEAAAQIDAQPALGEACRAGRLSAQQAAEIARAGAADPTATEALVRSAQRDGYRALRDRCRQVAMSARSRQEDQARLGAIHRSRYLRTWHDPDGAGRIDARMTPEALATILSALQPFIRESFELARKAGEREKDECYAADALLSLVRAVLPRRDDPIGSVVPQASAAETDGSAPGSVADPTDPAPGVSVADAGRHPSGAGPSRMVIAVVDHAALVRGHAEGDERCLIDGVGPVPVASVEHLLSDAFLAAVVTDGTDIRSVVHLGRFPTARQRTALIVRDPMCVVPGCTVSRGLEIDHVTGWEATHHTTLDQLARLCHHHHALKTYRGWTLSGSPGHWEWEPPLEEQLPGPFDDDGIDLSPDLVPSAGPGP